VIYDDGSFPPIHVSGHASQEELKLIINLVKPRFFIPIHGEYRQLKLHAEMAGAMHNSVGQVILMRAATFWSSTNWARAKQAAPPSAGCASIPVRAPMW